MKTIQLTEEQQKAAQAFEQEAKLAIKTAYENMINVLKSQPLNQGGLHYANAISRLDEFHYWAQTCPVDVNKLAAHLGIDVAKELAEEERQADEVAVHDEWTEPAATPAAE